MNKMKSYEFTRVYNPRLGKFVYKHKGSGIIVDNTFKVAFAATKNKTISKKSISIRNCAYSKKDRRKKWRSYYEKVDEKNLYLNSKRGHLQRTRKKKSTDILINRLISGSGEKN